MYVPTLFYGIVVVTQRHYLTVMSGVHFRGWYVLYLLVLGWEGMGHTVMSLIIRTIQLFEHHPLPLSRKNCVPSIQTAMFELNIRTPTPCRARTGVAFDRLCGARAWVTEHLLAYYRHFRTPTRLLLSLWSSNGGCQMCKSLWQSLQGSNGVAKHPSTISVELERG